MTQRSGESWPNEGREEEGGEEAMSRAPRRPKRVRDFDKVAKSKDELRNASSTELKARLARGYLTKDGAIAMRQLLEERGDTEK